MIEICTPAPTYAYNSQSQISTSISRFNLFLSCVPGPIYAHIPQPSFSSALYFQQRMNQWLVNAITDTQPDSNWLKNATSAKSTIVLKRMTNKSNLEIKLIFRSNGKMTRTRDITVLIADGHYPVMKRETKGKHLVIERPYHVVKNVS